MYSNYSCKHKKCQKQPSSHSCIELSKTAFLFSFSVSLNFKIINVSFLDSFQELMHVNLKDPDKWYLYWEWLSINLSFYHVSDF